MLLLSPSPSPSKFNIVPMETDRLGSELILSAKQSITIHTMLNFDGDLDGHGDGISKQTLRILT